MWQIINNALHPQSGRIVEIYDGDVLTTAPDEIMKVISKQFQSVHAATCKHCTDEREPTPVFEYTVADDLAFLCFAGPVKMLEYMEELPAKPGGHQVLDYHLLKAARLSLADDCWQFCLAVIGDSIPVSCSHAYITPIPKKDGGVRQISLSCPILKVCVETPLAKSLEYIAEARGMFPADQYGFRQGRSTVDNIMKLQALIVDAYNAGADYVLLVFIDIEKAFDRISHSGILNELKHHKIGGILFKLVDDYLRRRMASANNFNCIGEPFTVWSGTSQGGIPSSVLYNIAASRSHTDACSRSGVKCFSYCDDDLLAQPIFSDVDVASIQLAVTTLTSHLRERLELNANIKKSCTLAIELKQYPASICMDISLYGNILERKNAQAHLGIILDNEMTFAQHIPELSRKLGWLGFTVNCLLKSSAATGNEHNDVQKLKTQIYITHFLRCARYAMGTWRSKLLSSKQQLERCQKRFLGAWGGIGERYPEILRRLNMLPLNAHFDLESCMLVLSDFVDSKGMFRIQAAGRTRLAEKLQFVVPVTRGRLLDHTITVAGPAIVNKFLQSADNKISNLIRAGKIGKKSLRNLIKDWLMNKV